MCVVPSVDSGVIGCRESGRWSCALFVFARLDLCVICVLDLLFCRGHDSCQGRVFSPFLWSDAKPNTNDAVKFRQTHAHNLERLDVRCVVSVEVLLESET